MGGYLAEYGAGEERRWKLIKRSAAAVVLVLVVAAVLYFTLRDRKEKGRAEAFLELLRKKDYASAYQFWGCSVAQPCRSYSYERFLEDWGAKGLYANVSKARLGRTRSCETGVIAPVQIGTDDPVLLWISRADLSLSFAPWPVCTPKMKPQYAP
jgi:hypothetical protein